MNRFNHKGKKAFTLAEMLIVVAIIAVIVAIGVLQLGAARKNLQVKANDSNAKLIFLAAQNQMLQMKEYGRWNALLDAHSDDGVPDAAFFGELIAKKPSDYDYYQQEYKGPMWDEVSGDMRVIVYTAQDMEQFPEFLQSILPLGSVEDTVRTQGKYLIGYNLRTATVYGVFYTESDGELNNADAAFAAAFYGEGEGRPTGEDTENTARRIRRDYKGDDNKDCIVGYFGGGMLNSVEYTALQIPEIRIDNGEELILHIKDPNSNSSTVPVNGVIPRSVSRLSVTVRGKTSGGSVTYDVVQPGTPTMTDDSGYYLSGTLNSEARLVKYCQESADAITYEIYLDSITPGPDGQNLHFAENYCSESAWPTLGVLPGEDIEVTVTARPGEGSNRISLPVSRTVESSSLFAAAELDLDNRVERAEISQLRHLENLSSEIGGAVLAADVEAVFLNSVSFDGEGAGLLPVVPKDYTDKAITKVDGAASGFAVGSYVPVNIANGTKITLDGNGNKVYNIRITSENSTAGVGLLGNAQRSVEITDLGIVSSESPGTVRTVYTDGGNAYAVGAFVGSATALTMENCYSTVLIRETAAEKEICVVGGLVGSVTDAASITKCYVSANTVGGEYSVNAAEANIAVNAGGRDVDVGGLIGTCSRAEITDSYSVASIGLAGTNGAGDYRVGGLAGNVAGAMSVSNSYYAGWQILPLSVELNGGTLQYGGFVGRASGVTADEDSFWVKEFLDLTDVPDNALPNAEYAKIYTEATVDAETVTHPYDAHWDGETYDYPDVTGLGHWGDWCIAKPPIDLFVFGAVGIESVSAVPGASDWEFEPYGNGVRFKNVEPGTVCDLDELVSVSLKAGFDGIRYWDKAANAWIEETVDSGPEAGTHHNYTTTYRTNYIYVYAEDLDPAALTSINDIADVFNRQTHEISVTQATSYDASIKVRRFIACAKSADSLPTGVSAAGVPTGGTEGSYLFSELTGTDYTLTKDHHYGSMYYRAYVFAYCDDSSLPDGPLYSETATDDFTYTLSRVPVVFKYSSTSGLEDNWLLDGGRTDVRRYVEYGGTELYEGPGATEIVDGVIVNDPGSPAGVPRVTFEGYYGNAFAHTGWTQDGHLIYNGSGDMIAGYPYSTTDVSWKPTTTQPINLSPMWEIEPLPEILDPGGGYWEP